MVEARQRLEIKFTYFKTGQHCGRDFHFTLQLCVTSLVVSYVASNHELSACGGPHTHSPHYYHRCHCVLVLLRIFDFCQQHKCGSSDNTPSAP